MSRHRPAPIKSLEAYKHISPDSGYPTVLHPSYNPKIKAHTPPDPPHEEFIPSKDRGSYADPEKKALFAVAKPMMLTESIGTELKNAQLSQFNNKQLDELAALVNERGVVFFKDQDLTTERQVEIFEHFGVLDKHTTQKVLSGWSSKLRTEWLTNSRAVRSISLLEGTMQTGERLTTTRPGRCGISMRIQASRSIVRTSSSFRAHL
jgi:sulfonate dioxygenase